MGEARKRTRKRRRLLRVAIASGLLVVAVPSVATGHEHLTPVEALGLGRQGSTEKATCSMDPRDPRLMNPGAQLCSDHVAAVQVPTGQARADIQHLVPEGNERIAAVQVPTGQERAEIQHLVPEGNERIAVAQVPTGQERAEIQHVVPEGNEEIDQAPALSDGSEIEMWAWLLSIVVAAGGSASFFLLRRKRPHALG
jgi:hypothetical protein